MSFPVTLTRDDMDALGTPDMLPLRQKVDAAPGRALELRGPGVPAALSRPGRFRVLRDGTGGQILACNGLALAEAQHLLRQVYGASITFAGPTVHTLLDHASGTVLVPMMFLHIDAPRACRKDLLQLLARRSADEGAITLERQRVVVRAELPLARLIGVERDVLERTDGAAQVLCWLARYGPAPGHAPEASQP